ncbi:probable G-protein coupled receptor 156 isoform X2 [Denticeps clupeoides]|nr:probable G-protein coupled receptor 156 isoform X2 [Denticeps clupeoides]XP_028847964.1 probable G-protein coupled receptor 156 isoform X2 [Denticeps clupeoides]XP_028847965.1 probable G-protein coupled receptor 156 isoform X2 [Denticeps clupeoides]XP_028847967.1 probable G-protein coupled receptor 156 isoform X2 [Denticeps clupeoides]XP_028847968.1 probable G-protein coupled receptor 156 isoform X2 [Denticeps clupeoides]
MQPGPSCSSRCDSGTCYIIPQVHTHDGWEILQRLCTVLMKLEATTQGTSLSPVLRVVVWTLLCGGILLAFLFLLFTLRFRKNRIVKMSSPNLNVMTLCGSVMTYTSGFLFAIEEKMTVEETETNVVLQARIWTLCIGSSLVFGPILGKTWRLYRVFTHRVPDKRVIIRDIQLIGLVVLLVAVDIILLGTWLLTDPIRCARSVGAAVKVMKLDVSYSLSQTQTCSSHYIDLWIMLLSVVKGGLLLYGTYLAGLTSNISLAPVNQSLTIMATVCLVTTSTAVVVPVSFYLQAWPNVVYSVVSGCIFISTLVINCLLFVPQLTQWREFEGESSTTQLARFFSSPSKSLRSTCSGDEIYHLMGENNNMKRLITEKDAMIDSLQEQVTNAKDKLLKLVLTSRSIMEGDSSTTNLSSCPTQATGLQPVSLPVPPFPELYVSLPGTPVATSKVVHTNTSSSLDESLLTAQAPADSAQPKAELMMVRSSIESSEAESLTCSPHLPASSYTSHAEGLLGESMRCPDVKGIGRQVFVSSEQLREIVQDLSISCHSTGSHLSPRLLYDLYHCSISPYAMRKRRPPFYTSKARPLLLLSSGAVHHNELDTKQPEVRSQPRRSEESPGGVQEGELDVKPGGWGHGSLWEGRGPLPHRYSVTSYSGHSLKGPPLGQASQCLQISRQKLEPYYSDSDFDSSSEDYSYRRPCCAACRHTVYDSSACTSETSDTESEEEYNPGHPVVNFKEDLQPTFV